jgi:purine nucleosidase
VSAAIPLILDVDTGTDDALALAYAVESPDIDLIAATTVAGNVDVEQATANTLAVLDWLGASDVPVHRGASRPLVRSHRDARHYHGELGLGGAKFERSSRQEGADRGPAAIIRLARQRPGEITVVALGPLTNLAIALNVEPTLPELLKAVVLMGGAYKVPGNASPAAEFNIYADPEAAAQVFAAPFRDLTAVGLDVTEKVDISRELWDAVEAHPEIAPPVWLLKQVLGFGFTELGRERLVMHDPLAVAVTLNPELVQTEDATIDVETNDEEPGRTRIVGPGSVHVALEVDAARAVADLRQRLGLTELAEASRRGTVPEGVMSGELVVSNPPPQQSP